MNKGVISVLVAYLIWGLYPFSRFQYQNDKAEALSPRQI